MGEERVPPERESEGVSNDKFVGKKCIFVGCTRFELKKTLETKVCVRAVRQNAYALISCFLS